MAASGYFHRSHPCIFQQSITLLHTPNEMRSTLDSRVLDIHSKHVHNHRTCARANILSRPHQIHTTRSSFDTPLALATVFDFQFRDETTVPRNIFPFSIFFDTYDLTRHVYTCTHTVYQHTP